MAADLRDFRGKITAEADAALAAEARALGRDKPYVVRKLLHDWALQRFNATNVLNNLVGTEEIMRVATGAERAGDGLDESDA